MSSMRNRVKFAALLEKVPYFGRQMVDEAGKQSVYLQLLIIILVVRDSQLIGRDGQGLSLLCILIL
jgi:hypothetical protein